MVAYSFLFFLAVFVVIGVLSFLKRTATTHDYLLAGQNVPPWLVALSAQATNNSGYMFVGMIGFTYTEGLVAIWLMFGWIVGDYIASMRVHRRLREKSAQTKSMSYGTLLARWQGEEFALVRVIGGIITLIFLGTYAAAQFKAGSKALYVIFGWDYSAGAIIGAIIVLLYCLAGGLRASIWTDAAQSFVMVVAMFLLMVGGIYNSGGFVAFHQQLEGISPHYMDFFTPNLHIISPLGPFLFIMGWLFAGFGIIGQPHIMVRFMTMSRASDINRVRWYYYSWYIIFYTLTIFVGLIARLLLPELAQQDHELALPRLALQLFPDVIVGLTLAGLFAATMSTADSQILSCTGAITQDFNLNRLQSYWVTKVVTLLVTALALFIALTGHENVFHLVLIAWSALACTFAPLLTVYTLNGRPRQSTAVSMMLLGFAVMLYWRNSGWGYLVYEILPGMLAGFIPYGIERLFFAFRKT